MCWASRNAKCSAGLAATVMGRVFKANDRLTAFRSKGSMTEDMFLFEVELNFTDAPIAHSQPHALAIDAHGRMN